jgi:hypothetical protein
MFNGYNHSSLFVKALVTNKKSFIMLAAGFLSQWVVGEVGYCSTRHQGRVCLGGITITNTKRVILEDIFHYSVNVFGKYR